MIVASRSVTLIHIDDILIAEVSGTFLIRREVRDNLKSVKTTKSMIIMKSVI